VVLPPQTLENGRVELEVLSFKITSVTVNGNVHFSEANVLASLPSIFVGAEPDTGELSRAVRVANRHPSKTVKVGFADDKSTEGIEAKVTVSDERPWTLFASLDNTGTTATGELRLALGGQYTNLFGRDNVATVSYTTAPQRPHDVRQKGLNYEIPLYRYSTNVTVFYADSDVDSGEIAGLEVSGAGTFVGARARYELPAGSGFTHSLTLGVDDKLFESRAVPVGGTVSLFPNVRSRPLSIEYGRDYETLRGNWGFSVGYVRNLPFGGSNNGGAYRGNREGARPQWDALRLHGYLDYGFQDGWLLRASGDAQYSDDALISGEQFGVGGVRSVRGFDEREVSGDSGLRLGLELWTPPLETTVNGRLMAFVEWGHTSLNRPVGQEAEESLAGAGVGYRMQGTHWSSVGSLAGVADGAAGRSVGDLKAHLSVVWRY